MPDRTMLDDLRYFRDQLDPILKGIRKERDSAHSGSHRKTVLRKAGKDADQIEQGLNSLIEVAEMEPVLMCHLKDQQRMLDD